MESKPNPLDVAPLEGGILSNPTLVVASSDAERSSRPKRQERIRSCQNKQPILVVEAAADGTRLVEVKLDGVPVRTLVRTSDKHGVGASRDGAFAASSRGVLNVGTDSWSSMPGSEQWYWPTFVPNSTAIVVRVGDQPGAVRHDIVDYHAQKRIVSFVADAYAISPTGAVLMLRADAPADEFDSSSLARIFRLRGERAELAVRIPTSSRSVVTGIAAISEKELIYQVSAEHETRYLWADGRPFYSGGVGKSVLDQAGRVGMGKAKEQRSLSVSADADFAVFVERNWNELTYIVLVDLKRKRRIELPYFGSFPVVRAGNVVFASDPTFVNVIHQNRHDIGADDSLSAEFRPISTWALYAFDIQSQELCLVRKYGHAVQPY